MKNTKIEYSNHTSNPLKIKDSRAFYCVKVSAACKHCYAETMSRRLAAMGGTEFFPYKKMEHPPELELRRDIIQGWARRKKPEKIFVTSMTDVFGEFVPTEWVYEILDAMVNAPLQTFQVFTKRAQLMEERVYAYCFKKGIQKLPANIWLICTVEDQDCANERIPYLLKTKCSVRGLSMEPLLELVSLTALLKDAPAKIDWIIAGGESGHKARISHPDYFRLVRDECTELGIAFWFKQWGDWLPLERSDFDLFHFVKPDGEYVNMFSLPDATEMEKRPNQWDLGLWAEKMNLPVMLYIKSGKKKNGHMLDGIEHNEFPVIISDDN